MNERQLGSPYTKFSHPAKILHILARSRRRPLRNSDYAARGLAYCASLIVHLVERESIEQREEKLGNQLRERERESDTSR